MDVNRYYIFLENLFDVNYSQKKTKINKFFFVLVVLYFIANLIFFVFFQKYFYLSKIFLIIIILLDFYLINILLNSKTWAHFYLGILILHYILFKYFFILSHPYLFLGILTYFFIFLFFYSSLTKLIVFPRDYVLENLGNIKKLNNKLLSKKNFYSSKYFVFILCIVVIFNLDNYFIIVNLIVICSVLTVDTIKFKKQKL
jgi:hypothetical protein